MSPYQIVNGKECHLPVELKYKAWWAINKLNFDYDRAKLERMLDINELEEIRNDAYINSSITKKFLLKFFYKRACNPTLDFTFFGEN